MGRRLGRVLAAVAACALALAALVWRFPIALRLPELVVRHESTTALLELADYVYYVHVHLAALGWDPETGLKDFRESLAAARRAPEPDRLAIGRLEWHRGDFAAAIEEIEAHHRERGESEESVFWLALAYLRQAEAVNCLAKLTGANGHGHASGDARHSGMCTLPLTRHHDDRRLSRSAAELFTRLLDEYDPENRIYQWLLNFAYMTTDEFPARVPERYRIRTPFIDQFYGTAKTAAEIRHAGLRFEDHAAQLGVAALDAGKGVAVEDFDRDGDLDIITGGTFDPMRYYRNEDGRFDDRSEASGLAAIKGTHLISAADYDNDGWIDVFASRPMGSERGDFVLLRNRGDGTFRDVTVETGLLPPEDERELYTLTWASAWADIDADGDLDLFVSNWGFYSAVGAEERINPLRGNRESTLYRNDGGRFVDVTESSGLADVIWGRNVYGAAFGDYDNDGDPDLAFTPQWLPGLAVARNVGGGRFETTDLVDGDAWGFMTAFVDVNHDGRLDIYVGSTGQAPGVTKQAVFGEGADHYRTASAIWLQTPDGRFEAREDFFPGRMPLATMGASFGDVNNDGAYDFYVGTGSPEGWLILPNLMYLGVLEDGAPTGATENVSMLQDFGTVQKGHGIVFFDFDGDGDQDIYSSLGGLWPADRWPNQLFVNESELSASWTKIRLRGRKSNHYGVGARIRVLVEREDGAIRSYHYYMDNKTGFGSAPYLAHLGLADAAAILRVEVTWPGHTTPVAYPGELGATNLLDENGTARVIGRPGTLSAGVAGPDPRDS